MWIYLPDHEYFSDYYDYTDIFFSKNMYLILYFKMIFIPLQKIYFLFIFLLWRATCKIPGAPASHTFLRKEINMWSWSSSGIQQIRGTNFSSHEIFKDVDIKRSSLVWETAFPVENKLNKTNQKATYKWVPKCVHVPVKKPI